MTILKPGYDNYFQTLSQTISMREEEAKGNRTAKALEWFQDNHYVNHYDELINLPKITELGDHEILVRFLHLNGVGITFEAYNLGIFMKFVDPPPCSDVWNWEKKDQTWYFGVIQQKIDTNDRTAMDSQIKDKHRVEAIKLKSRTL